MRNLDIRKKRFVILYKMTRRFSQNDRTFSLKYAHGESNPNRWNRNPLFYPLNYGRIINILTFRNRLQK